MGDAARRARSPGPAADRRRPRALAGAPPARRAAVRPARATAPRAPSGRRGGGGGRARVAAASAARLSRRRLARRRRRAFRPVSADVAPQRPSPAHLQPHDRRADGDDVADLGAQPGDLAIGRRGDLDRRLVGHHRGEDRVLAHEVADLDAPFDEFGLGDALADIGKLDDELAHRHASIVSSSARADARGPGEIVPFLRMRIGRVPAGDARDRRLEMIEAMLLHQRGEFRAEARGQRRLVDDHAAAGLLHRGDDRLEIERQQRAQVDDFGVDAGLGRRRLGDMDHRAIGEDRQRRALRAGAPPCRAAST